MGKVKEAKLTNLESDIPLMLAANKYADSDNPFLGQQRTFQAFLAGAEWVEIKYRALMSECNWDGTAWTMRPIK